MSGRKTLQLSVIVAVAALFRIPWILHDGLWRDQAFVYVDVVAPAADEFLRRVASIEYHPPLYFAIAYVWTRFFGTGELSLQLLPFSFSVATVPLVYLLGRDADCEETGLVAAAIFAVAPTALAFSDQYVYPFAGFAFALAAWLVSRARRDPATPALLAAVAASALLCVYAHYTALLFLPLLCLWALFSPRGARHGAVVAAALCAGALPFAFWLPVFLHQRTVGIPYQGSDSLANEISWFLAVLIQVQPLGQLPFKEAAALFVVAAAALLRGTVRADVRWLAGIFVTAVAIVSFDDGLRLVRYVVPFYALWCVVVAALAVGACSRLARDFPRARFGRLAAAFAAAAVVVGSDAAFAAQNLALPKSGIRTLAMTRPFDPQTLYVVAPDYLGSTFAFYSRGAAVTFRGFVRSERPEQLTLDGYARDWNRAGEVGRAVEEIALQARAFRCIDLIVDRFATDEAPVPYVRVRHLYAALSKRYRLAGRGYYPGRFESIDVYRFDAVPAASGEAGKNCR